MKVNLRSISGRLGNSTEKRGTKCCMMNKMLYFKTALLVVVLKISWGGVLLAIKVTPGNLNSNTTRNV